MVVPRWPYALLAVGALPLAIGAVWIGCATASEDPGATVTGKRDAGRLVRDGEEVALDPDGNPLFDADDPDTGLQCPDAAMSNSCASATEIATLAVGGTSMVSGAIDAVGERWYKVTFTGTSDPAAHPHVTLTTSDPGIIIDVVNDCTGTTAACGAEDAAAKGVKEYEIAYRPDPLAETSPDPPDGEVGVFDAHIPIEVGASGVLYLRVYRGKGKASSCDFKLDVSN